MRIKFYVDRKDAPISALMINVAVAGKRFRYSSGISIAPKDWNHDSQEARGSDPSRLANMKRIAAIKAEIHSAYHALSFGADGKVVSNDELIQFNSRIKTFLEGGRSEKPVDVFPAFKKFIDQHTLSRGNGQITNERPSDYTLQRYNLVSKIMAEYAREHKVQLTFEGIDDDFYRSFVSWLSAERNLIDSSIGNYIKVLKTFMRWAKERGLHTNTAYERFYKPDSIADTIALSARELRILRDTVLTDSPKLARVRDHFLMQTYTALRYGDLITLGPKNFDLANGFVVLPSKKTEARPVIPIIPPLQDILKKYPSLVFEFNSGVKANLYLKELGKRAGIDSPVVIGHQRNGVRHDKTVPKYTQLTTHVARRSFVTVCLEFGLPETIIRQVTGHKSSDVMSNHYSKLTPEMVRDAVCNAWGRL